MVIVAAWARYKSKTVLHLSFSFTSNHASKVKHIVSMSKTNGQYQHKKKKILDKKQPKGIYYRIKILKTISKYARWE